VLPALNEEDAIERVVTRALEVLAALTAEFEIIVVDDGSTDRTGALLDALAAGDPRVRVIHFRRRSGYGAALRAGFAASRLPLLVFTDSDGQFDLADLERLLPLLVDADLVVGFRAERVDAPSRKLLSRGYNLLVRVLLHVRLRDINCAFKLFHRRVLDAVRLVSDGYAINAELVARADAAGLRVRELGVRHLARLAGRSKVGAASAPAAVRELWALRRAVLATSPQDPSRTPIAVEGSRDSRRR
jgi:glycosyltransferase involved in cell wall biosynthesis